MNPSLSAHWQASPDALVFEKQFADFRTAFAFLEGVAELAETQDHHPEIWNVYNKVKLTLNTHDAGNIVTNRDWKLAAAIDGLSAA